MGRMLDRLRLFPFRCQLCTARFHAFWTGSRHGTQSVDRRQFKRLATSLRVHLLADNAVQADSRVTDISMAGCTVVSDSALPRGTFLELSIMPATDEEPIKVDTAMVSCVRPGSMGVRFLEFKPVDKQRLSEVVLSLLVGQSIHPDPYA